MLIWAELVDLSPAVGVFISSEGAKKTDVAEHPEVFDHVGLLVNGLPGAAGLPFI
jgi:hypothetical protein